MRPKTPKKSNQVKTFTLYGVLKDCYETFGEGIGVYIQNQPFLYLKKGSPNLSKSDEVMISHTDYSKQFVVTHGESFSICTTSRFDHQDKRLKKLRVSVPESHLTEGLARAIATL